MESCALSYLLYSVVFAVGIILSSSGTCGRRCLWFVCIGRDLRVMLFFTALICSPGRYTQTQAFLRQ